MVSRVADLRPDTRPIDTDVQIPPAVKRAAEAAERAQRQAYNLPEPTPAPADGDGIKIVEPPAPTPVGSTVVTPTGNEPAPAPEPQPAPQPAPQPPQPKAPIPDAGPGDTFETRFKAEYGRTQALRKQLGEVASRCNMLEDRIADLMQEVATQKAAPASTAPQQQEEVEITDKDREEFGPEMIALMERVARKVAGPVASTRQEIATLAERLKSGEQRLARTAQENMIAHMDAHLPEWRKINHMPEYLAWLALPDRYSGVIRNKLLSEAWEQNDTPRVHALFEGFVSELAATAPAELPQPAPPVATPQPAKPGLESLAAPGRARQQAGATPPPAEKQIITTSDVKAFYADIRAGKYRGREAERNALEAELFVAQREGRVVPG